MACEGSDIVGGAMNDEWGTPQTFFDLLDKEFHFQMDVCASKDNAKCKVYLDREKNALTSSWSAICWMNPPYGREIKFWMKKALEESIAGSTIVCLIPARTSSPWWHDYVLKASEIRFVERKMSFTGPIKGVPFWGSVVVVFRPNDQSAKVSSQRQK